MKMLPLPEDARQAIRDHKWDNIKQEKAATWDGDQAVFAKVRTFENVLAAHADTLRASGEDLLQSANEQLHDLAAYRQEVMSGVVVMDATAAKRFEVAAANVNTTIANLEALRAQLEHSIARCEDPLAALQSTLSRFPALRQGRSYVP